jgi:putative sigma-54 modulation protein
LERSAPLRVAANPSLLKKSRSEATIASIPTEATPIRPWPADVQKGVAFVQIKIAARHGHLNETTQQMIRDRAEKLLHFFERLTLIEVTVDLKASFEKKEVKMVEFVVQAEHKHDLVAREHHPDLMAAVDLAVEKLEGQLRRYKEKIQDHRRTPHTGRVTEGPATEEPTEE